MSNAILTEEQEGYLFNVCINLWEKVNKKPSVRFTAFRFIIKIANKHTDLANEISFYTQNQYLDTLSPAVNRSIYKMIKASKINSCYNL